MPPLNESDFFLSTISTRPYRSQGSGRIQTYPVDSHLDFPVELRVYAGLLKMLNYIA